MLCLSTVARMCVLACQQGKIGTFCNITRVHFRIRSSSLVFWRCQTKYLSSHIASWVRDHHLKITIPTLTCSSARSAKTKLGLASKKLATAGAVAGQRDAGGSAARGARDSAAREAGRGHSAPRRAGGAARRRGCGRSRALCPAGSQTQTTPRLHPATLRSWCSSSRRPTARLRARQRRWRWCLGGCMGKLRSACAGASLGPHPSVKLSR